MVRVTRIRSNIAASMGLVGLALALTTGSPQRALASTAAEQGAAEMLFRESLELMQQGKFADACPKLARSLQLDPAVGTRFKLAECDEASNKLASAWLGFTAVADELAEKGEKERVREKKARARAAALLPRLSRLEVSVDEDLPGLRLTVDGQELAKSAWGVALPIDGGEHVVRAEAAHHQPFSTSVRLQPERDRASVHVRPLEPEPPPPEVASGAGVPSSDRLLTSPSPGLTHDAAPSDRSVPSRSSSHSWRVVGWTLGGLGLAGAAVTGVFVGVSASKWSGADNQCPANVCSTQEALDQRSRAIDFSDAATIVGVVSLVSLATSATILLLSPSGSSHSSARMAVGPGSVTLLGSF